MQYDPNVAAIGYQQPVYQQPGGAVVVRRSWLGSLRAKGTFMSPNSWFAQYSNCLLMLSFYRRRMVPPSLVLCKLRPPRLLTSSL